MIRQNQKLAVIAMVGALSAGLFFTTAQGAIAAAPITGASVVGITPATAASNGVVYPAPGKGWKYDFASQVVGGTGAEYTIRWDAVPGATSYVIVANEGVYSGGVILNKWITLGQFDAATTEGTVTYERQPSRRAAQSFFVVALNPDGQRQSVVKGYSNGNRT